MSDPFCTSCGHQNPVGSRFCGSCGSQLRADADLRTQGMDPLDSMPTEPAPTSHEPAEVDAWLVVSDGHRRGTRFPLAGELVTAGRHPDSDIFLDDITVSRRHVEIKRAGTVRNVRDVGSLNGTYLNGERIEEAVLSDGDEVQIGKFKLVYLAEST